MQCTCVYLPYKLLKTEVGLKADHFAECHGNMSVAGDDDPDIPKFDMIAHQGWVIYCY